MGLFDFFQPPPQECEAPITLPESLQDIMPPAPDPELEPEPPDYRAAAAAAAALIAQSLQDDEECKECDPCKAVAVGSPDVRQYGDTPNNRKGYEYQHYVVSWFLHEPQNRIIMDWRIPAPPNPDNPRSPLHVDFDGLDAEEGRKLWERAIPRSSYDPTYTSHCYLIDTKYGHDWFRYDAWEEEWVLTAPSFLRDSVLNTMRNQNRVTPELYPNVAIVWICSNRYAAEFIGEEIIPSVNNIAFRVHYYPFISREDQ